MASGGGINVANPVSIIVSTNLGDISPGENDGLAWWDRPGGLVTASPPPTTPRRQHQQERKPVPMRPESTRNFWSEHRRQGHEAKEVLRRESIENALRRRYNLGAEFQFPPEFFDVPLSSTAALNNYREAMNAKSSEERQARQSRLRDLPGSSPLREAKSANDLDPDEVEMHQAFQETLTSGSMDKAAARVREEVGYLYFVGVDAWGWKDDYLNSRHRLIYRHPERVQELTRQVLEELQAGM
ncbi:hypothetical protein EJ04DRAFT_528965 [Polyplosphaeria fusca]|uniref:Uncharacterized protein n=1 Tax=Polyplosphaeria fusca TaxID=682080 RepID=A0A9P4UTN6_9PLEO|nr:hypothetical protein EJ04DRAFT_528965 [Polyplosphaeria fusca]